MTPLSWIFDQRLLLVIGAMKGGTSSLHRYLDLHPEIAMSRKKELDFFLAEKNWHKGKLWWDVHRCRMGAQRPPSRVERLREHWSDTGMPD